MTTLRRDEVRARVESALAAGLDSTWTQSAFLPAMLGFAGRAFVHKSWSVSVGRSSPGDRQRLADGTRTETELVAGFVYQLREGAQLDAYDEALTAEKDVVAAAMALTQTHLHVRLLELAEPAVTDDGKWAVLLSTFICAHRLALS